MMIAESMTANFIHKNSPIQHFPVEKGYFRSKLIVTDAFVNPLIAAASPLISILERIHIASELPELNQLHQHIGHEFKAFYSQFHRNHYSEELHLLANYLLAATTDEILGKSYLRLKGQAQEFSAFTPASLSSQGPEFYFFEIIDYLLTSPEQFLDLIELAYFCLLIGFEGKYHQQTNGRVVLDNLIENLFLTIQKLRTNKIHKLFKSYVLKAPNTGSPKKPKKIILLTTLGLLALTLLSQLFVGYQAKTTLHHAVLLQDYSS
jgi:type VI secretion system protein ImpK